VCPGLAGLLPLKLAALLVLLGGVERADGPSGSRVRGDVHARRARTLPCLAHVCGPVLLTDTLPLRPIFLQARAC
jgi:hypothetical protein